ncbi:MotA/TolQ/ExbB proton channel family protein [bacterium]|nr:MotA/TolQ/ExbB proton channel family protein [bacterium]
MRKDLLDKIIHASWEAQLILITLAIFSVVSWAIMGSKFRLLRRAIAEIDMFMERFRKARDLEQIQEAARDMDVSPIGIMVSTAVREVHQLRKLIAARAADSGLGFDPTVMMRDNLLMSMERVISDRAAELRKYIVFLATCTTISPFLGLLGTVWGIMISFLDIATKGSANIAVVAPGIADALTTTVAGLFVAIPAVVGYNYLNSRVKMIVERCNNFALELAGIIYKSSLNL